MVLKKPGLEMDTIMSELDLTYKERYGDTYIPDAYERLILDAMRGDQQHFVRRQACSVTMPILWGLQLFELENSSFCLTYSCC